MNAKSQRKNEKEVARAGARRIAVVVTIVIVAAVIVGAVVFYVQASRRASAGPVAASSAALPAGGAGAPAAPAAAPGAPAAKLDAAADAVGFHVTNSGNVGLIENLPSDTTLLAPSATLLAVGAEAPGFTLSTPEGTSVSLSSFRGKVVLLEFFATWCPHCQAEAPHLLQLYAAAAKAGVEFLSVNGDSEDPASVHAFARYFKTPWPSLLDPGTPAGSFTQQGGIGPVSRAYGLSLFPTFYIIDAKGRVAWRADREQPDGLLQEKLRDAAGH